MSSLSSKLLTSRASRILEYHPNHYCVIYSGDKPLSDALHVMNNEGVSSIVVVDYHLNVIGNISTADVKVHDTLS